MRLRITRLCVIVALLVATLAMALPVQADVIKPIYKTHSWEALNFYGDVSYARMYFHFDIDGTVRVNDDADNELVIKPPAVLVGLTQDKDLVIQDFGNWQIIYDFSRNDNEVKISYKGSYYGKIEIPLATSAQSIGKAKTGLWNYKVGVFDEDNKLVSGITYDWFDARDKVDYDSKTGAVGFEVTGAFDIDPSVVGTPGTGTLRVYERGEVFVNGLHWVFYGDGTDTVYRTSADGSTWSGSTVVAAGSTSSQVYDLSVFFDGTYLHYVRLDSVSYDAFYRRGVLNSNGTITWSVAEQTVLTGTLQQATICVNTGGYPFITYYGTDTTPYVIKSDTNDGTWSTQASFPYQLTATTGYAGALVVPLEDNDVYCIYARGSAADIYGKKWTDDTTSWSAQGSVTGGGDPENAASFSAIANGDSIYLTYLEENEDIRYVEYTDGVGWGVDTLLYNGSDIYAYPAIGLWDASGDLRVFYSDITNEKIYEINRTSGSWDGSPSVFVDETGSNINSYYFSCFYEKMSGYLGVVYRCMVDGVTDSLKYAFLVDIIAPTVTDNAGATNVEETTATLNGNLTDDGGAATTVHIYWGDDDAGTTAVNWDNDINMGVLAEGTFNSNISDLDEGTKYYYRCYASNSVGSDWADATDSFTTKPEAPTGFTATAGYLSVDLAWTEGTGATKTYIRGKVGSYPTDRSDGIEIYYDTGESFEHTPIDYGDVWYYRAWSWVEGSDIWSDNYVEANSGV